MSDTKGHIENLAKRASRGDLQSIAKLLSRVEADLSGSFKFLSHLVSKTRALRIGITGPPGAGKSSLINLMIEHFRSKGRRVGVLAVDPSSPFSGGALLGDRVRMGRFATDQNVFIRSVGSRGALGGLSAATGAMAHVLEYCGYDTLIIETVGVGQTELQVMNLADATAVVLVPESGDVIQTLKAGILEIADAFVVNKADRPGASVLIQELKALVAQEARSKRPVFETCATENRGVAALSDSLYQLAESLGGEPKRLRRKAIGELRSLILSSLDHQLCAELMRLKVSNVYATAASLKIPKIKLSARTRRK